MTTCDLGGRRQRAWSGVSFDWARPGMYDLADPSHLRRLAELDLTTILTTTGPTWSDMRRHVSADSDFRQACKYDSLRYVAILGERRLSRT